MAKRLITAAEFADLNSDISKGWEKSEDKINRCIDEAQSVDLYDVLEDFYYVLVSNSGSDIYSDLMNGSAFIADGIERTHDGIKKYLAGLAYVRYLGLVNKVHTPHGYVNKTTQNSESVTYEQIKGEQKQKQSDLETLFKAIDNYLQQNKTKFPNYKPESAQSAKYNSIKTSTLR